MKKRIVLGLVLLASLSMLISSFAHAESLPQAARNELLKENEKAMDDVKAMLTEATDEDSRDLIQARMTDLQTEHEELNTQLD